MGQWTASQIGPRRLQNWSVCPSDRVPGRGSSTPGIFPSAAVLAGRNLNGETHRIWVEFMFPVPNTSSAPCPIRNCTDHTRSCPPPRTGFAFAPSPSTNISPPRTCGRWTAWRHFCRGFVSKGSHGRAWFGLRRPYFQTTCSRVSIGMSRSGGSKRPGVSAGWCILARAGR